MGEANDHTAQLYRDLYRRDLKLDRLRDGSMYRTGGEEGMDIGVDGNTGRADIDLLLKHPADVRQTSLQDRVYALEEALVLVTRENNARQKAQKSESVRYARAEATITATLGKLEALQEENIVLAEKEAILRDQLVASENARSSEQARFAAAHEEATVHATEVAGTRDQFAREAAVLRDQITASQSALAAERAEVAVLRNQLIASESARRSAQHSKVKTLQKQNLQLSMLNAQQREELAILQRKLNAVHRSVSWRITRPLRGVKLPSLSKKTR